MSCLLGSKRTGTPLTSSKARILSRSSLASTNRSVSVLSMKYINPETKKQNVANVILFKV